MASFKFIVICTILSIVNAGDIAYSSAPLVSYNSVATPAIATHSFAPAHVGYVAPSISTQHENTVRSFAGTVAHQSKAVDTPFSSVRKEDTRISNNVYTPAIAHHTVAAAPLHTTYATHGGLINSAQFLAQHRAPVLAHSGPAAVYAHSAPAAVVAHSAPAAVVAHSAPLLAHSAPVLADHGYAAPVYHLSFQGHGATYGW